ncbi:MAG: hypothetical protein QG596_1452 [Actinomycetota bacterium]|nr:hypothetical protein [Actinomycetota bacterium]
MLSGTGHGPDEKPVKDERDRDYGDNRWGKPEERPEQDRSPVQAQLPDRRRVIDSASRMPDSTVSKSMFSVMSFGQW